MDTISELKNLLSTILLQSPYDPSSRAPENYLIQHVSGLVRDYESGNIDKNALLAEVSGENLGDFDMASWIAEKEETGEYAVPE